MAPIWETALAAASQGVLPALLLCVALRRPARTLARHFSARIWNRYLSSLGVPKEVRLRLIVGAAQRDLEQAPPARPDDQGGTLAS